MTQGTRGSRSGERTAHAAFGFAPLALILACVALWTWALTSSAAAGGSPSIQVTQCTGDPATDPQSCDSKPTTVQVAKPAPRPAARPAPRPAAPAETHDYSLSSGKGTVQTPNGKKKPETIKVTLSPAVQQPATPAKPHRPAAPPPPPPPPVTTTGGAPTTTIASPFSFVSADQALAQFEIPPFLVPIYLAAGRTYGIPWNVLASINRIETDFGRNLSVSTAGAEGWMQFMPDSWKTYGVDATGDGVADPYNPVDAIYAAARYLRASGGATDLRKAIFSYNHANWYVDEVLKNAGVYGSLPPGLVAETGSLAFGRFPLVGRVRYADDFQRSRPPGWGPPGLLIHGLAGARAVATQQVTVRQIQLDPLLARTLARTGNLAGLGGGPVESADQTSALALRGLTAVLGATSRARALR
ncbi:MAG: lytic transglycosylase domain-containing protein, partial [Actinomycetota bacterium]|nr:lytic transglycosylase domain-containing protein [Actinomycetota bacterium]